MIKSGCAILPLYGNYSPFQNDFYDFHLSINTVAGGYFILHFPEHLCGSHLNILQINDNPSF